MKAKWRIYDGFSTLKNKITIRSFEVLFQAQPGTGSFTEIATYRTSFMKINIIFKKYVKKYNV